MKTKRKISAFIAVISFVALSFFGCETETQYVEKTDTTAPNPVLLGEKPAVAGNGSVLLSWTNPGDTDFYGTRISFAPKAQNVTNPIVVEGNSSSSSSALIEGLSNGTEYTFTLVALDKSQNSSLSVETKATPVDSSDKTAPAEVSELSVQAANGNAVLSWTNPGDEDFAGVKITASPAEGTLSNAVILEKGAATFSVSGLSTGKEYTFTVQTFDTSLNYSEGASKTETISDTSDKTAPAEVSNLSAENLDGAVLLSWKDPSDEDLFGIEITYTGDENTQSRAVSAMQEKSVFVAPKTQSAEITNLKNGTEYTFTLKAMDISGNKSEGAKKTITPSVIQGNAMQITLTPSTTEITNQDVSVGIKITTDASEISTVKYESGAKTVPYFASNGKAISADENGAYSFSASENGTYTVYAFDSDGRREIQTVKIENIDKTAPNKVSRLAAYYDGASEAINVTWESSDTDIDHYLVGYSIDGVSKVTDENVSEAEYSVPEVKLDSGKYTFTVKAVDKAGNTGNSDETSLTPVKAPFVSSITLDRTHIAYNDTDKTITVTVKGSNFDLIEDVSTFKVQIVDSSKNVTTFDATVDKENNTATSKITVPSVSSETLGTDFTVRAKIGDDIDDEHTATFNVSDSAKITEITLNTTQISVKDVTSGMTVKATVSGTNFDTANATTIQFYDSTDTAYGSPVTIEKTSLTVNDETHETVFEKEIAIPTVDDMYTLKVLFDGSVSTKTANLQVYGTPAFTSFAIPKAGTSKADNIVTATVTGKNFTAPGVTSDSFELSCGTSSVTKGSEIEIISDSKLKATLTIPGKAGEYKVTIKSGSETFEGTFTVKDYSDYTVGKIILADGSLVESSSYTSIDTNNPPVAVVAGLNDKGEALGVGLHKSDDAHNYVWRSSAIIYSINFPDIICTPSETGIGAASTATFTGDTDGSDNWDVICSVDPEGSADAETNYPAFNWANNYGTMYAEQLGSATDGWYMPSIAELCSVYRNLTEINASLTVINGIDSKYMESLSDSYFWSSSQSSFSTNKVWYVDYYNGNVDTTGKATTRKVLVVRAF